MRNRRFGHVPAIVDQRCGWKNRWVQEVAVSISDFALGALSAVLAFRMMGRVTELVRVREWFVMALGAVAGSALLGGITHGFLPDTTITGALVWRATLIVIGIAAYASLMIASILLFRPGTVDQLRWFGLAIFAIYVGIVLFEDQDFAVALGFYVPSAILLLIAFVVRWRRQPQSFALDGVISILLTLIAGALQHFHVDLHPVYFDHNVIYHVVQAIAVAALYRAGARWLDEVRSPDLEATIA